eukprot:m.171183 g.171183  ORF g.171183 m.171183 type:complete len:769 (-) comp25172_c0_seq2:254-2560(-)
MGKPKAQSDNVKVAVRCRPMGDTEVEDKRERCVEMDTRRGAITVTNPKDGQPKSFTFDDIFDWNSEQIDIYNTTARPIVDAVLQGFNGTIFAYGQTGTGKTYTMEGIRNDPNKRGIIPNSFEHIFQEIAQTQGKEFLVRASYLEIYTEEIRDLLSKNQKQKLILKEKPDSGVYVKDLSSFVVKSVKEIEHVMSVGNKNRMVGCTDMNKHSSRSHAIFIITVECSETGPDGENHIRVGKLNLVDLAGSERQGKTHATGQRLAEGIKINSSLSALGNVIAHLVDGKSKHIPYRNSKLTRLLQDSLGGNAKTVMLANIGPADYNFDETVTTLRYANRAKNIKNKPKINEDPKDALLREFQEELARLQEELAKKGTKRKKKKKKKYNEQGEEIPDSSDDDDDLEEEVVVDEEEQARIFAAEREKLETEKKAMLEDQTLLKEEREKLAQQIEDRSRQLEERVEANEALAAKIKAMQSKLLKGGKNVIDRTTEQEKALEKQRIELAQRKHREREMQRELEEKEEQRLEMQDTFTNLQQEAEVKTKKLKKIFAKLQAAKTEIEDLQEEFVRDRQDLLQNTNDLQRELRLRQLIIEQFIPEEEETKIKKRAVFDEEYDQWRLAPLASTQESDAGAAPAARPVSAMPGGRRAITEYARMRANVDRNPRYKADNILQLELDMPERTTHDYAGPVLAPRVQAALDDALKDEEDLTMEETPDDFLATAIKKAKKAQRNAARPKTGKKKERKPQAPPPPPVDKSAQFPSSRGFIMSATRFA